MFKNCKKTVCSTNSVVVKPNPKKVTVVRHTKSEFSPGDVSANSATNKWLQNGGVLPLVSIDPTVSEAPSKPKPVNRDIIRKPAKEQCCGVPKPTKSSKPQMRSIAKKVMQANNDTLPQEVFKNLDCEHTSGKQHHNNRLSEKRTDVVDKENYINIISHFNEANHTSEYNPADYSETKCTSKATHHRERQMQINTTTEKKYYNPSGKSRGEILQSIREEIQLWKSSGGLKDWELKNQKSFAINGGACGDPMVDVSPAD